MKERCLECNLMAEQGCRVKESVVDYDTCGRWVLSRSAMRCDARLTDYNATDPPAKDCAYDNGTDARGDESCHGLRDLGAFL